MLAGGRGFTDPTTHYYSLLDGQMWKNRVFHCVRIHLDLCKISAYLN